MIKRLFFTTLLTGLLTCYPLRAVADHEANPSEDHDFNETLILLLLGGGTLGAGGNALYSRISNKKKSPPNPETDKEDSMTMNVHKILTQLQLMEKDYNALISQIKEIDTNVKALNSKVLDMQFHLVSKTGYNNQTMISPLEG